MISTVISAIIGDYLTTVFVLGLIIAGLQVWRLHRPRTAAEVSGIFLRSYLLWAVGIGQILNFVMHSFFGDYAARTIGWAQSPFQLELAFSSLGLGVAAIVLHGRTRELISQLTPVLMFAIFGYGAAGGHIYQQLVHHDHAVNNGGLLLAMDVVIPTIGLLFVLWAAIARRPAARAHQPRIIEAASQASPGRPDHEYV
jgi:predicted membrane protein